MVAQTAQTAMNGAIPIEIESTPATEMSTMLDEQRDQQPAARRGESTRRTAISQMTASASGTWSTPARIAPPASDEAERQQDRDRGRGFTATSRVERAVARAYDTEGGGIADEHERPEQPDRRRPSPSTADAGGHERDEHREAKRPRVLGRPAEIAEGRAQRGAAVATGRPSPLEPATIRTS